MRYAGPEEVENIINAKSRHCRIGKVTRKEKPVDRFPAIRSWPATPKDWWKRPFPVYDPLEDIRIGANRKCSCLPGQACANAACPHRLVPMASWFDSTGNAWEVVSPSYRISEA